MAKAKPTPAEAMPTPPASEKADGVDLALAGETPATGAEDPPVVATPPVALPRVLDDDEDDKDHPLRNDPVMKDARAAADEILRLRARVKELEAEKPAYVAGKKYKVTIKDGPTCVVMPKPGEHPWEAVCRLGGIASTTQVPVIGEAAEHEKCGTHLPDGTVRPFAV